MFDRHNRRHLSSSLSAQVVEYLRKKNSQAKIARMLHVSEAFVSLVKQGERSLTIDHLELLADSLSMPLGAMLLAMTKPKRIPAGSERLFKMSEELIHKCDKTRDSILRAAPISKHKASA